MKYSSNSNRRKIKRIKTITSTDKTIKCLQNELNK